jgi:hypothetical protein
MRCRLLLGLLVLWALSAGSARADNFNGVWFRQYDGPTGKVTLKAELVSDVGRFELELIDWPRYGRRSTCRYYVWLGDIASGEYIASAGAEMILNSGSSSDDCVRRGQVSLTRDSYEQIEVSLEGLEEVPDLLLYEVVRPLGDWEWATLPENFDILGVSLGMTREEIEKNLIDERGFVVVSQKPDLKLHKTNWIAETITYRRSAENGPRDEVIVAYSTRYYDEPEEQDHAIMVRRESHLGRYPNLTADVLREALTRKYGPPTEGDDRRYGRDGRSVRRGDDPVEFCEPGNRDDLGGHYFGRFQAFQSHCGSELDVYIETDRSTGFVEEYQLTLTSVDYINNNRWMVRAVGIWMEVKAFLEAMESAATSGPEL